MAGLYLAHHSWVLSLLRRRPGNREQVLDLPQDTFVRLLRSELTAPLHEPRASLGTVASRAEGSARLRGTRPTPGPC
ncbi:sigma factor [Pseudomonas sp. NBRC 111123]|uniref:sigma factor n=1 Tax=Pseudomonas sp. NBRC 111123 TaxID=1661038 RepID=UPI0009EC60B7|nr:sigma factor [Pseudomonas sp. NBRC 111123]